MVNTLTLRSALNFDLCMIMLDHKLTFSKEENPNILASKFEHFPPPLYTALLRRLIQSKNDHDHSALLTLET